ncbi:hsp70 family protein [Gigaspora margarita]|uniref:Hsp70 family protein n=1 Tax=Gigaspora margarita TaxID=4874 RepID=A0A8H4AUT0_GIGMA|nr:hsp70 family protein [Gigaspora margarita]
MLPFFSGKDKDKSKAFNFEIDGEIFTKRFEPDMKLEDVRKKLAERRDNWKAEKLMFKQNKRRIYHEDEPDYTLNKLHKSDKSNIIVENLLKEIKVHVNSKKLKFSLDPEDKLKDIHTILEKKFINDGINENSKDFKFRWENGKIVSKFEVYNNSLKEILVNSNELYIVILQEDKVMIYSDHSKTPSKPLRHTLDKGKSLVEIRKELENTLIEQSNLYMCPNCCFLDQDKAHISKSEENKLKLGEILSIKDGNDVLNLIRDACQEHEHDLIKLINKCGYGFIIKNGSVEQAVHRAFTIVNTPKHEFLEDGYEESSFECKNEFGDLCERNFITFGNVKASILPWVSVFFGIDYKSSLKKLKKYKETKNYSYVKMRKAYINILKDNISATTEFSEEVKKALNEETQSKKVENLQKIAEKYGYFYASSVYFGGVIIEKLEDIKHSNKYERSKELDITVNNMLKYAESNTGISLKRTKGNEKVIDTTNFNRTVKGGNKSKFRPEDRHEWIDSIKNSEDWEIIEYHEIYSIFSLLDDRLQKDVIEVLGKRILKVKVESIHFSNKINHYVHELSNKLDCIGKDNIKDCHIFATVLKKKKDRHIFSSCVSYDGRPDKPKIIITRAPSKKKPTGKKEFIIQIGWMVIGYPADTFDLELSNQVVIESEKFKLNDQYIVENISHRDDLESMNKYAFTTCVLDHIETSSLQKETASSEEINSLQEETTSSEETNSLQEDTTSSQKEPSVISSNNNTYDTKLIVGFHIYQPDAACLFVYRSEMYNTQLDNDQQLLLQFLKLFICTIYIKKDSAIKDFKQKKVKWNNRCLTKTSSVWHSKIDLKNINNNLVDKALIFIDQAYNKYLTKKSTIQNFKTDKDNFNTSPIFINQLFSDTDPDNNNCHGIINVSPEHFQLRILNDNKFATKESEISYFRIPQEINVVYS